ncbi:hypothetical protein HDU87_000018 [Geranomyces variabilis]|uniref:Zinc finger ZPR1-type domain-containing protein n=1 Tax=Geranomyces variabilis TaxID=109894 RepID=A0AAD5XW05_9FUNG|nr:hypothetical protein HDU87_000018 [Geranomyces variabilis]
MDSAAPPTTATATTTTASPTPTTDSAMPDSTTAQPEPYHLDLAHQETDRIIEELQKLYHAAAPTPQVRLPIDNIAQLLTHELGYEDLAEFEDSLHGTFTQFLAAIPEVDLDAASRTFRFRPEPAEDEWVHKRWTINVTHRDQLWWVLSKSAHARIEIPEIEFEIAADGARHIDSFYNHIANAAYNIARHAAAANTHSTDAAAAMAETVANLHSLLDLDRPFTIIIHDPSGTSDFANITDVEVERGLTMTFE